MLLRSFDHHYWKTVHESSELDNELSYNSSPVKILSSEVHLSLHKPRRRENPSRIEFVLGVGTFYLKIKFNSRHSVLQIWT